MSGLSLAIRMTARDWRAGELRFLLVALVVAVAALASVGFFVDRMRAGLERDAHQLLGADVVIVADQPINPVWRAEALRRGLQVAETATFPSMALAEHGNESVSQLAALKAVSPGYPLRGHLTLGAGAARDIPRPGTVWVDPVLLPKLSIGLNGTVELGDATFKVAEVIAKEPDRGASFVNFAPRIMLNLADLPATHLVQNGSRVSYRLLVAGEPKATADFQQWMQAEIEHDNARGVAIESLESSQQEMRATLDRANRFLSLVALLSAMLAAVAVAMAARRFMLRHIDACAMLRCLGMTQNQAASLYLLEFLAVGVAGSVVGAVLGFAAHYVLLEWLGQLVSNDIPPARWLPGWQAMATGMVLLVGFALPPILQLRNVPHNRVIRREQEPPQPATVATYVLGMSSFAGLLLWQTANLKLAALTAGGFLGALLVFALVAWLALKALARLRELFRNPGWRFVVTALQRRTGTTVVQIVSLALGLMALLLLTVVRGDLIDAWRNTTPPDAPNHFLINIQPDQKDQVASRLIQAGVVHPDLYPMIRGRLVRLNDQLITGKSYAEGRAQHLVDREFNLSAMNELPSSNTIAAGRWYEDSDGKPEASVEEGIAKTLGIHLGDRLVFDVAGQTVQATVTSLRKLEWGSMRVNFFVIINSKAMADLPQTWITAFHLPETDTAFVNALTRDFPNLTAIDVGSILKQVREVIDQVVAAVEFLFLFALVAGVLVLYAALASSQDERKREAGILRSLGATRTQLTQAQWMEFALIGSLAGALAASGAAAVGWALARFVFDFAWHFDLRVWLAGIVAGGACAMLGGWAGLRNVLNSPPLATLREA